MGKRWLTRRIYILKVTWGVTLGTGGTGHCEEEKNGPACQDNESLARASEGVMKSTPKLFDPKAISYASAESH